MVVEVPTERKPLVGCGVNHVKKNLALKITQGPRINERRAMKNYPEPFKRRKTRINNIQYIEEIYPVDLKKQMKITQEDLMKQ